MKNVSNTIETRYGPLNWITSEAGIASQSCLAPSPLVNTDWKCCISYHKNKSF